MSAKKAFLIRIDHHTFNLLEKWAADELRSVNAQIEFVLTDALKKRKRIEEKQMPIDMHTEDDE